MDRQTRHDLKTDKFVEEFAHAATYVGEHKSQFVKYAVAAVVVILLAVGGWYFMQSQKHARQSELTAAMKTYNSVVGVQDSSQVRAFPTEADRQKAILAEFTPLTTKFSGTDEGAVASYLLGVNAADQGKLDDAVKNLQTAASSNSPYQALAKLSLADVYAAQGKSADAEKLLREVMAKPSIVAPKDLATLNLARLLGKSKPDEARKLLEDLRSQTGAASRAAVNVLGELQSK